MNKTEQLLMIDAMYGAPLITQEGMGGVGRVISMYINHPYSNLEKENVLAYMDNSHVILTPMGWSYDYINHGIISGIGCRYLSDGLFVWCQDLSYYVRQYDFRLPGKFLNHMITRNYVVDAIDLQDVRRRAFGF